MSSVVQTSPLSYSQLGLWCVEQLHPGNQPCRSNVRLRLRGKLALDHLKHALYEIIRRHAILRSTFRVADGVPLQYTKSRLLIELPLSNLMQEAEPRRSELLERVIRQHEEAPFDLERGPMIRAHLVRLDSEEHLLLLALHHLVCDAWSLQVLTRELITLYDARVDGTQPSLPELTLQYSDFARWQRQWCECDEAEPLWQYWRTRLSGPLPSTELPTDRPRLSRPEFQGASHRLVLQAELFESVGKLARQWRMTPSMFLLGAASVLLARYGEQEEIVLGFAVTGRTRLDIESLIGPFVNILPVRVDLTGEPRVHEILLRVRNTVLGALDHQDLPFELLLQRFQSNHDSGRAPVLSVCLNTLPPAMTGMLGKHLQLATEPFEFAGSLFDLTIHVFGHEKPPSLVFNYSTERFEQATIERTAGHFQTVLRELVADIDRPIWEVPLLTDRETRQLLVDWNRTDVSYPDAACIHELFQSQVQRTPNEIAVASGQEQLTYVQLNERANQVAHVLISLGVVPDSLVGVGLERCVDMIVALLGVLKAGGAYLPLPAAYPRARLRHMQAECDCRFVLTHRALASRFGDGPSRCICLDDYHDRIARQAQTDPDVRVTADNLAYVNYTSGSTGCPKGVEIAHRSVVRLLMGQDYAQFDSTQVFLHHSTLAFDAATLEIWGPLLHGGKCVLLSEQFPTASVLRQAIREHGVTALWLTASAFNSVVDEEPGALRGLTQLLIGGESLSPSHVRKALEHLRGTKLINGYGPTESTTFTCSFPIELDSWDGVSPVPIGRPIANTHVYVLDTRRQLVPIGVPGELYIGGDGLARSYRHDRETTAQKFVPHPFDATGRVYNSQDIVKWLPNGNLALLGRTDEQVKVRGFRVEPGEVEHVLRRHPSVRDAVIVVQREHPADTRLVACVQFRDRRHTSVSQIRGFLQNELPPYLVPTRYVVFEQLPRTDSGKMDRPAILSHVGRQQERIGESVGPRTAMEQRLTEIWEASLRLQHVGIHDNFFEIGGHSLLAVSISQAMERKLGLSVGPATLLGHPTIASLSEALEHSACDARHRSCITLRQASGTMPIFLVPSIGGDSWHFRRLAELLEDHTVYALQLPESGGTGESFATIEDLAAYFVDAMGQAAPCDAAALVAYSFAGKVAFEMAQQLTAQGRTVQHLVMIDAGPGEQPRRTIIDSLRWIILFARNLPIWVKHEILTGPLDETWCRVRNQLSKLPTELRRRIWSGKSGDEISAEQALGVDHVTKETRALVQRHLEAWKRYTPRPYPVQVSVLRARGRPLLHSIEPDLGWKPFAEQGVEVRVVCGDHRTILVEPHVRQLATELLSILNGKAT